MSDEAYQVALIDHYSHISIIWDCYGLSYVLLHASTLLGKAFGEKHGNSVLISAIVFLSMHPRLYFSPS